MPLASCGELNIAYDERGEGPALVLLMGLGSQMIMWPEAFCDALAGRGLRVIRMDNRDVGLSSKFDGHRVPDFRSLVARAMVGQTFETPYTLFDMADDVIGLLDHLEIERAHIMGVSLGSMIAQCAAIRHGHRMHSVSLMMTTPGIGLRWPPTLRAARALLGPLRSDRDGYIDGVVSVMRVLSGGHIRFDDGALRERAAASYDRCFYPAGPPRQIAAILGGGDRTRALRKVEVPALVIHGAKDPLIPIRAGRDAARAMGAKTFVEIAHLGHNLASAAWPQMIAAIAAHVHAHPGT